MKKGIKVTLREKKLNNGKVSQYLDFYPPIERNGKLTRREHLGSQYHYKQRPANEIERTQKNNAILAAKEIAAVRQTELNKADLYNALERKELERKQKEKGDFLAFIDTITAGKHTKNVHYATKKHIRACFPDGLTFGDVNRSTAEKFATYLLNTDALSYETARNYFFAFKHFIKIAYERDAMSENLAPKIHLPDAPKDARLPVEREALTLAELEKLATTPFHKHIVKRAALFSAQTGLRFSDIVALDWSSVKQDSDGTYVEVKQAKTAKPVSIPLNDSALALLGDDRTVKPFAGLKKGDLRYIAQWLGLAGINKHITFHCFRHTFATLLHEYGTDVYTISHALGHTSIRHTQRYAKVTNTRKRAAVNLLPPLPTPPEEKK